MYRVFTLLLLVLVAVSNTFSQSLNDLSFGTDNTLDVVTWNIEHFPKNGQATKNYVKQIITNLDADIIAIQEVSDTNELRTMVSEIDGYSHYCKTGYLAGLAYVYKSDIQINDAYQIYTSYSYWKIFPRAPMVLEITYNNQDYIVVNNHLKCCGDGYLDLGDPDDEETRRHDAIKYLKQYVDGVFPNGNVIIVGDLNDVLTDNSENNVFKLMTDDSQNYRFADKSIAEGSNTEWSFPSWPSHLDHIIITNELFNYVDKVETIKIDDYMSSFSQYDYNVSDHRPVGIRLNSETTSTNDLETGSGSFFKIFPNPVQDVAKIEFYSGNDILLNMYSLNGEKVHSIKSNGENIIEWNLSNLPNGVYFIKAIANNRIVKTEKLILLK